MNLRNATDAILAEHPGMSWEAALAEASYRETHPQTVYSYRTDSTGRVVANRAGCAVESHT
jgi:hypothetical protein